MGDALGNTVDLNVAWKQAEEARNTGFFRALKPIFSSLERDFWPTHAALNALNQSAVISQQPKVQFVAVDAATINYELFIHQTNSVPTRENWHDLFNALAWLRFPQSKAALNVAHIRHIGAGGENALKCRSAARDALTLFDESGIIVVSDKRALLELIPAFEWRELFVEQRAHLAQHMLFLPFGHALMEKMLQPYVGMVAKVILLEVESVFFTLSRDAQCAWCDAEVAALVSNTTIFDAPKNLLPLPFLGVPGWDARNEDAAFYDNTNYFRPGSREWDFSIAAAIKTKLKN